MVKELSKADMASIVEGLSKLLQDSGGAISFPTSQRFVEYYRTVLKGRVFPDNATRLQYDRILQPIWDFTGETLPEARKRIHLDNVKSAYRWFGEEYGSEELDQGGGSSLSKHVAAEAAQRVLGAFEVDER